MCLVYPWFYIKFINIDILIILGFIKPVKPGTPEYVLIYKSRLYKNVYKRINLRYNIPNK